MFFVAGVLAALAGLFYAAGHHELGSAGVPATYSNSDSSVCYPVGRGPFFEIDSVSRFADRYPSSLPSATMILGV
jgi:hypothetical protein